MNADVTADDVVLLVKKIGVGIAVAVIPALVTIAALWVTQRLLLE